MSKTSPANQPRTAAKPAPAVLAIKAVDADLIPIASDAASRQLMDDLAALWLKFHREAEALQARYRAFPIESKRVVIEANLDLALANASESLMAAVMTSIGRNLNPVDATNLMSHLD